MEKNMTITAGNLAVKAATAKKTKRTKPAAKAKYYHNFSPSICEPNPGYCETIIANATKSAGGVMYASIPIKLLDLDRAYQRELGPHVQEIADHWDEFKAGVLWVSYRDGRFYVVDGQNRFEAAKMIGLKRLHCMIHVGWTQKEEALAFAKQNERKKRLSSADVIRAEIIGEDPVAISVKKVCDEFGVVCAPYGGYRIGSLRAADRAKRIVATYGEDLLRDIFYMIRELGWHAEAGGYGTVVLHSIRNVLLMSVDRPATMSRMLAVNHGDTLKDFVVASKHNYPTITNGTEAMTKQWVAMLGNFLSDVIDR